MMKKIALLSFHEGYVTKIKSSSFHSINFQNIKSSVRVTHNCWFCQIINRDNQNISWKKFPARRAKPTRLDISICDRTMKGSAPYFLIYQDTHVDSYPLGLNSMKAVVSACQNEVSCYIYSLEGKIQYWDNHRTLDDKNVF